MFTGVGGGSISVGRRGGEEERSVSVDGGVVELCFLGPAVGDSSTVRSK